MNGSCSISVLETKRHRGFSQHLSRQGSTGTLPSSLSIQKEILLYFHEKILISACLNDECYNQKLDQVSNLSLIITSKKHSHIVFQIYLILLLHSILVLHTALCVFSFTNIVYDRHGAAK